MMGEGWRGGVIATCHFIQLHFNLEESQMTPAENCWRLRLDLSL